MSDEERDVQDMDVGECEKEINETLENFDHSYWGERGPAQKRAVERMRVLHEKVFPDKGERGYDGLTDRLEKEGIKTNEDMEKLIAEKKTGNDEDELELTEEEKLGLANLETEWGGKEIYEKNIKIAQDTFETVAEQYGDNDFRTLMDDGLGNNPVIIRLFHRLGVAQEAYERESKEALNNFVCPHCGEKITEEED